MSAEVCFLFLRAWAAYTLTLKLIRKHLPVLYMVYMKLWSCGSSKLGSWWLLGSCLFGYSSRAFDFDSSAVTQPEYKSNHNPLKCCWSSNWKSLNDVNDIAVRSIWVAPGITIKKMSPFAVTAMSSEKALPWPSGVNPTKDSKCSSKFACKKCQQRLTHEAPILSLSESHINRQFWG